ncbi:MAG: hypothetical protein CMP45_03770 [Rickettsiales bacterium]|nr:hypothetical protein [Rickettsiales bacterium]
MSAKRKEKPLITSRGKGLAGMSTLMFLVGSFIGQTFVVQSGIFGFLVLIVCYWLAKINLKNIQFIRKMPSAVFSGVDFDYQVEMVNYRKWLGSRNVMIYDHYLPFGEKGFAVDAIGSGRRFVEVFKSRIIERGISNGRGYRIASDFPLGLFEVSKRRRGNENVLVYPRPMLTRKLETAVLGYGQSESSFPGAGNRDGEICGVREFQKGDKVNQIIWASYAKTGKFIVRDYDFPVSEKLSIIFHSYCPSGKLIWPEVFEHSMSLIAGLLMVCRERGIPFEICGPFTGWRNVECKSPSKIEKFLEFLSYAKHEPESSIEKISEILTQMKGSHPVFLVSETDVKLWADQLPNMPRVIHCVDNKALKSMHPDLKLIKRVA